MLERGLAGAGKEHEWSRRWHITFFFVSQFLDAQGTSLCYAGYVLCLQNWYSNPNSFHILFQENYSAGVLLKSDLLNKRFFLFNILLCDFSCLYPSFCLWLKTFSQFFFFFLLLEMLLGLWITILVISNNSLINDLFQNVRYKRKERRKSFSSFFLKLSLIMLRLTTTRHINCVFE